MNTLSFEDWLYWNWDGRECPFDLDQLREMYEAEVQS